MKYIYCVLFTQRVHPDIMEWVVEKFVADSVLTTNPVTMSMECVLMVARMDILAYTVTVVRN